MSFALSIGQNIEPKEICGRRSPVISYTALVYREYERGHTYITDFSPFVASFSSRNLRMRADRGSAVVSSDLDGMSGPA